VVQAPLALDPKADAKIPLGIGIDEQRPEPALSQGEAQVDDRGCLARSTLLIRHRDDPHRASPRTGREVCK
jgi:hypothetical protein